MNNIDKVKENIWNQRILVLYQITDKDKVTNYLEDGVTRTTNYLRILTRKDLVPLANTLDQTQALVIVAIPDRLHEFVYSINPNFFSEYKSQFDYEANDNGYLDEISSSYSRWDTDTDVIENFIPRELIYGSIEKDKNNSLVLLKNKRFYDYLSEIEKIQLAEFLKEIFSDYTEYDEYMQLIKKRNTGK